MQHAPFAGNVKDNRRHRQPISECSGPWRPHSIVCSRQYFIFSLLLLPSSRVGHRHRVPAAVVNCVICYIIRSHASKTDMGWSSPPYIHASVVHCSYSEHRFGSNQLNCRGLALIYCILKIKRTGVRKDSATKRALAFNCQLLAGTPVPCIGIHTKSFISEISLSTSSMN